MKQNELFSYVYDFVSQLLDNGVIFDSVKKIILFGSLARGDFRKDSDVDLFVDLKLMKEHRKIDGLIKKELDKFESRSEKTWHLREIDLPIKVIVGDLEQARWKDLREEVLAYGKILYGKFEKVPEKLNHQILINYDMKRLPQKRKMGFLRRLYGYVIKKGRKEYVQEGIIDEIKGEKLGAGSFIISADNLIDVKKILRDFRVKYELRDVWLK